MNYKATKLLIIGAFLLLQFFILPEVQSQTGWKWEKMTSNTEVDLRAVSGGSRTDVFAVGTENELLYYGWGRGKDARKELAWQPIQIFEEDSKRSALQLNAVWGGSEENVFAVGDQEMIIFGYKGAHWSMMRTPDKERIEQGEIEKANLKGIWGSSCKNVFAVGSGGRILHYDGDGNNDGIHDDLWEEMKSGTKEMLNGVWGSAPDNVYAVGNSGTILHYNGKMWSPVENLPSAVTDQHFNAIWGSAWRDIYVVGSKGVILHYDGDGNGDGEKDEVWEEMESGTENHLNGIQGNSSNNVYAVGDKGIVLHYTNKKWEPIKNLPNLPEGQNFSDVWVSSNPHVFIIGNGGTIIGGVQYQGAYWIGGYVYDIHTGSAIPNVEVFEKGNPQRKALTSSEGFYDNVDFSSYNPTLIFSAQGYKTEERDVSLRWEEKIPNDTYLLKNNETYSIAGVVSKECLGYDCPLEGVAVKVYKDTGGYVFPSIPYVPPSTTDSIGRYNFSDLPAGIYKIEPAEPNCSFSTKYVSIPQNSPPIAFDFTGTGTGECQCSIDCPKFP